MSHIQCINIFATADFDIKKYADFSKQEPVSLEILDKCCNLFAVNYLIYRE